ncbi:hypothetical protein PVAG01_08838 [Phlyctema vagabunda]|uniref:BTB domain-containing protein n=1 Tax=Phlyctema vagabunda TaxID=108571 RepID=A0ABR4PAI8_9HELO
MSTKQLSRKRPCQDDDTDDSSNEYVAVINCPCGHHRSVLACHQETVLEQRRQHTSVTAMAMGSSQFIAVEVGEQHTPMYAHKTLLMLHSERFRHEVTAQNLAAADSIFKRRAPALQDITVSEFMAFCSWVYLAQIPQEVLANGNTLEGLWQAGYKLKCPDFQNVCLEFIRRKAADKSRPWPLVSDAVLVYHITAPGCKLRQFVADILAKNNPIANAGIEARKDWQRLYDITPDLTRDMAMLGGKNWKGTQPWDVEHHQKYAVRSGKPLSERYSDHIRNGISDDQIWHQAETDPRRAVERDHLAREDRKKARMGGASRNVKQPAKPGNGRE